MDSNALRLSIVAIITTVVLIAVVVYAANRDRINALIGVEEHNAGQEEVANSDEETTVTQYGEQIGDNLKGFLTADDFFDKSEQRPSVVVVVDNQPVPANSSDQGQSTDLYDVAPAADDIETETDKTGEQKSEEDSKTNKAGEQKSEEDPKINKADEQKSEEGSDTNKVGEQKTDEDSKTENAQSNRSEKSVAENDSDKTDEALSN